MFKKIEKLGYIDTTACPTSVVMVVACCLVLELCLKCHKSLSQLFVCAEFVKYVACMGLSQGLVGQARWSR